MTWSKQVAHFQDLVGHRTEERHAKFLAMKRASHEAGDWNAIYNIVGGGLCGFIGFGPEYSRRTLGPIHTFVENAIPAFLNTVEGDGPLSTLPFEMLDSTNFFELLGYPIPREALASMAPLLSRIDTSRNNPEFVSWHWQRGFIALALRQDPVWRGIAGLMPGPLAFTPGESFGPNVQGLLGYLAAAIENHARLEDVLPGWKTFLAIVPGLFNADQVNFETLFWIARIVYHDIGGQSLGSAGDHLFADIQELAAAGL